MGKMSKRVKFEVKEGNLAQPAKQGCLYYISFHEKVNYFSQENRF